MNTEQMNKLGTGQNGSGHQVITKWSPSGHHRLKILDILGSMLKGRHVGPTLWAVQTVGVQIVGCPNWKAILQPLVLNCGQKPLSLFYPPFLILPCLFSHFFKIFISFYPSFLIHIHLSPPLSSIFTLFGKICIRMQSCWLHGNNTERYWRVYQKCVIIKGLL